MVEKSDAAGKKPRKIRSVDDEIAAVAEKLRKLKLKKSAQEKQKRESVLKAVVGMITAEGLDGVDAEVWKSAMPKLKVLLGVDGTKTQPTTE